MTFCVQKYFYFFYISKGISNTISVRRLGQAFVSYISALLVATIQKTVTSQKHFRIEVKQPRYFHISYLIINDVKILMNVGASYLSLLCNNNFNTFALDASNFTHGFLLANFIKKDKVLVLKV